MNFENLEHKKWKSGDTIYINRLQWEKSELEKMKECLDNNWFAGNSKYNKEFEKKISDFSGLKYVQTTNSGSSALELSIQALIQTGKIKRGDRFLHPIQTFPTSFSSAVMFGMTPIFIDVGEGTYIVSDEEIIRAFDLNPDISFAIIPALLGNVPNIELLKKLLGDKPLILDSCDLMGGKWDGNEFASYGTLSCYSFYGSHTISTLGVGGAVGTNDPELYKVLNSLAFWGRNFETDTLPDVDNFLKRYSYLTIGFDAQMSAIQAAFGLAQFDRLSEYLGQRKLVFDRLIELFSKKANYFVLPQKVSERVDNTWFCFPIKVRKDAPFTREEFVKYLLEHKIEVRPTMANVITNQPPYQNINCITVGHCPVAFDNEIRAFFLPCCPMESDEMSYYFEVLEKFMEKY